MPDDKTYTGSPLAVMTNSMRMIADRVDDGDLRAWDKLRPFLESHALDVIGRSPEGEIWSHLPVRESESS